MVICTVFKPMLTSKLLSAIGKCRKINGWVHIITAMHNILGDNESMIRFITS